MPSHAPAHVRKLPAPLSTGPPWTPNLSFALFDFLSSSSELAPPPSLHVSTCTRTCTLRLFPCSLRHDALASRPRPATVVLCGMHALGCREQEEGYRDVPK
eukprot:2663230-Rhodomonas_salina.2